MAQNKKNGGSVGGALAGFLLGGPVGAVIGWAAGGAVADVARATLNEQSLDTDPMRELIEEAKSHPQWVQHRQQLVEAFEDGNQTQEAVLAAQLLGFVEWYVERTPDLLKIMADAARGHGLGATVIPPLRVAVEMFVTEGDGPAEENGLPALFPWAYAVQRYVEKIAERTESEEAKARFLEQTSVWNELARRLLGDTAEEIDEQLEEVMKPPEFGKMLMNLAAVAGPFLLAAAATSRASSFHREPTQAENLAASIGMRLDV